MSDGTKRLVFLVALLASGCGKSGNTTTDLQNESEDAGCPSSCLEGQTLCGNRCIDTRFDPGNCGACGNDCGDEVCQAGSCVEVCAEGDTVCGDGCVNVRDDAKNCGVCGLVCARGSVCQDGQCVPTCSYGLTLCGDSCADLADDPNNCGACGTCCGTGHACRRGLCECDRGFTNCEGVCTSLERDVENCGACDHHCQWNQVCLEGSCQKACQLGQTLCDPETCADLDSDPEHCGDCDIACAPGQGCASGVCVSPPLDGGLADAGPEDAGPPDAGPPDAGPPDAGPEDAGGVDAGPCPGGDFCSLTETCVPDGGCCTSTDCPAGPNVNSEVCTKQNECAIQTCSAGFVDVDRDAGNGCECADSSNSHSCIVPTDLGTLDAGGSMTWSGNLPSPNEENWAQVTFRSTQAACQSQQATIAFSQNPGNDLLEVYYPNCQEIPRGGTVDNGIAWLFAPNCTADGGSIGSPGGPVGTVYIRVYQAQSSAPTCDDFTLLLHN